MTYGICNLSAIALRKEARHGSEMVSQLLYNEPYTILDKTKEWVLIQTDLDRYQGWIQAKQLMEISDEEHKELKNKKTYLTNKPIVEYKGLLLSMGTPLHEPLEGIDTLVLPSMSCRPTKEGAYLWTEGLGMTSLQDNPDVTEMPAQFQPELLVDYAKKLLGAPYLWGGRSVMGIDCSGLVQVCARLSGKVLPRDASQQVQEGEFVYFLQETQPGDLAFFGEEDGHITHVGIVMGNEQIIHASGQVRIDYLDQTGIFNKERNEHTHRLQVIKRLN